MQRLKRVQNNLTRITLTILTRASAEPLLKAVHWLPVVQCIQYIFVMPINRIVNDRTIIILTISNLLLCKTFFHTTLSTDMELLAVQDFRFELAAPTA